MIGKHLRVLKAGRWLHAIDCGDETVLHLADEAAPRRVRRAYRPEFVAGAESVEEVLHRERTFPPREIVRRAYSRAADSTLSAMFRDSEAFAEWCATGRLPGVRPAAGEAATGGVPAAPPAPVAAAAPAAPAPPKATPKAVAPRSAAPQAKPAPKAKAKAKPAARKAAGKVAPKKAAPKKAAARKPAPRAKPAPKAKAKARPAARKAPAKKATRRSKR